MNFSCSAKSMNTNFQLVSVLSSSGVQELKEPFGSLTASDKLASVNCMSEDDSSPGESRLESSQRSNESTSPTCTCFFHV